MPEFNAIHTIIAAVLTVVGIGIGWVLRSGRAKSEKLVASSAWQEQLNAQRIEHDRLTEQNKALMEQISQHLATSKDAKNRIMDLNKSLQDANQQRERLQAQAAEVRIALDTSINERKQLQSRLNAQAAVARSLALKDAEISKLQQSLEEWKARLPPLIDKYARRNKEAEALETELAIARDRIEQLKGAEQTDQTRIEPVHDPDELTDGRTASNEAMDDEEDDATEAAGHGRNEAGDEAEGSDKAGDSDDGKDTGHEGLAARNEPGKARVDFIEHDRLGTVEVNFRDLISSEAFLEPDDDAHTNAGTAPDGSESEAAPDDSAATSVGQLGSEAEDAGSDQQQSGAPDRDDSQDPAMDDVEAGEQDRVEAELDIALAELDEIDDDIEIEEIDDEDWTDVDADYEVVTGEDPDDDPETPREVRPDDLRQIKGIGPAIEKTLIELGIRQYQQIADMSEYDIDRIAKRLKGFRSRIYRENWIGQARDLLDQNSVD